MGGLQHEKGKFPAQPQVNPLSQHSVDTSMVLNPHLEHLKSIIMVRSDKKINKIVYPKPAPIETDKSFVVSSEELKASSSGSESVTRKKGKKCFVKFWHHLIKDSECQMREQRMLKFISSSSK